MESLKAERALAERLQRGIRQARSKPGEPAGQKVG
jgi:hypothetical protein